MPAQTTHTLRQSQTSEDATSVVRVVNKTMLDAKDVLAPFRELLGKSQGKVLLGLRLVERIEHFPGPTAEEEDLINRVSLMGPAVDMAQAKRDFKAWILRNGLEEVHASV